MGSIGLGNKLQGSHISGRFENDHSNYTTAVVQSFTFFTSYNLKKAPDKTFHFGKVMLRQQTEIFELKLLAAIFNPVKTMRESGNRTKTAIKIVNVPQLNKTKKKG